MKKMKEIISVLVASLIVATVLPMGALADKSVTVEGGDDASVVLVQAESADDTAITPDKGGEEGDGDGYTYTTEGKTEYTAGQNENDETTVTKGNATATVGTDNEIKGSGDTTDAEAEAAANEAGIYEGGADTKTEDKGYTDTTGGVYTNDSRAFLQDGETIIAGVTTGEVKNTPADIDKVNELLKDAYGTDASGNANYKADKDNDYLVKLGTVTVDGDKVVQEATVTTTNGDGTTATEDAYKVTLSATASAVLDVYAGSENKEESVTTIKDQDIVLVVDVTTSMEESLGSSTKWAVLKEAVTDFIKTVYGLTVDSDGNIVYKEDDSVTSTTVDDKDHLALTLVIYGGENSGNGYQTNDDDKYVAATVGTYTIDNIEEILGLFDENSKRADVSKAGTIVGFDNTVPTLDGTIASINSDDTKSELEKETAIEAATAAADAADYALDTVQNTNVARYGTNNQAGYVEATAAIDRLKAAGLLSENVSVVYMTDGEANNCFDTTDKGYTNDGSYTTDELKSTVQPPKDNRVLTSGTAAVDAEAELLERGVELFNIVINDSSTASELSTYYDADYSKNVGNGKKGVLENALTDETSGQVNYSNSVTYKWTNTADGVKDIYSTIAKQIASEITAEASVAFEAKVIDVVPAGFTVYFDEATANSGSIKVVGVDANGNTVIEWNRGSMTNAGKYEVNYFLVPNDDTTYGTVFTNDSAILFCRPLNGEDTAIVLPRTAVMLDVEANDDSALNQEYDGDIAFNVLDDKTTHGDGYTLKTDGMTKVTASGTTVSEIAVNGISGATYKAGDGAAISVDVTGDAANGWKIDLGEYGCVTIDKDGNVSYTKGTNTGSALEIKFDYSILTQANYGSVKNLTNGTDSSAASAKVTITINAKTEPTPTPTTEPTPTPTTEPSETITVEESIPLGEPVEEEIPLGTPMTGGSDVVAFFAIAGLAAAMIFSLALINRKRGN